MDGKKKQMEQDKNKGQSDMKKNVRNECYDETNRRVAQDYRSIEVRH